MEIRVACFGDTVGSPGRKLLGRSLPRFIEKRNIHFVVVNGENAAGGSGITRETLKQLWDAGADVVTTGDHAYKRPESFKLFESEKFLLRPANLSRRAIGRGHVIGTARNGIEVGVLNLIGRIYIGPADCPFDTAERLLLEIRQKTPLVIVDFHAEATSEKIAMGWFLDGKASGVFGTHTHVQTADETILPNGTGYITDVGMVGPHKGVLGRTAEPVLKKFITNMPFRFKLAKEWVMAKGIIFTLDHKTGKCLSIERVVIKEE